MVSNISSFVCGINTGGFGVSKHLVLFSAGFRGLSTLRRFLHGVVLLFDVVVLPRSLFVEGWIFALDWLIKKVNSQK